MKTTEEKEFIDKLTSIVNMDEKQFKEFRNTDDWMHDLICILSNNKHKKIVEGVVNQQNKTSDFNQWFLSDLLSYCKETFK